MGSTYGMVKANNDSFKFSDFEIRSKEIDLLQSIINMMAESQLKVKGFCVSICSSGCFFIY